MDAIVLDDGRVLVAGGWRLNWHLDPLSGAEIIDTNVSSTVRLAKLVLYDDASDPVTARDKFDRRVSELWWVGREFVKYGQIKGVNDDLSRELKARKYTTQKGPEGLKIKVETKPDMKDRLGFSPDLADSFAVALDIARSRFGALAGGIATGLNRPRLEWESEVAAHQAVFENITYGEQAAEYEVAEPSQWG
jgi:hypothetical protein